MTMDIEIKKELAIESYKLTFDKDLAYAKAEMTEDEIKLLENDPEFQTRLNYFLVLEREEIVREFKNLLKSPDEKIRFATIKELGPLIYPAFFNRNKDGRRPVTPEEVLAFFANELNSV